MELSGSGFGNLVSRIGARELSPRDGRVIPDFRIAIFYFAGGGGVCFVLGITVELL